MRSARRSGLTVVRLHYLADRVGAGSQGGQRVASGRAGQGIRLAGVEGTVAVGVGVYGPIRQPGLPGILKAVPVVVLELRSRDRAGLPEAGVPGLGVVFGGHRKGGRHAVHHIGVTVHRIAGGVLRREIPAGRVRRELNGVIPRVHRELIEAAAGRRRNVEHGEGAAVEQTHRDSVEARLAGVLLPVTVEIVPGEIPDSRLPVVAEVRAARHGSCHNRHVVIACTGGRQEPAWLRHLAEDDATHRERVDAVLAGCVGNVGGLGAVERSVVVQVGVDRPARQDRLACVEDSVGVEVMELHARHRTGLDERHSVVLHLPVSRLAVRAEPAGAAETETGVGRVDRRQAAGHGKG